MIIHKANSDRLISHYHLDVGDYPNEAGFISSSGSYSRPRLWVISQPCQIIPWLFRDTDLRMDRSLAITERSFFATRWL
jgi:hypothetical protein